MCRLLIVEPTPNPDLPVQAACNVVRIAPRLGAHPPPTIATNWSALLRILRASWKAPRHLGSRLPVELQVGRVVTTEGRALLSAYEHKQPA